mmetsp:Transcript_21657/g.53429  ORF Transcript_21657/g.53429 Transcript_21657/m.53429 type:complete len:311 (+) Transcript_21657:584-1516(+)
MKKKKKNPKKGLSLHSPSLSKNSILERHQHPPILILPPLPPFLPLLLLPRPHHRPHILRQIHRAALPRALPRGPPLRIPRRQLPQRPAMAPPPAPRHLLEPLQHVLRRRTHAAAAAAPGHPPRRRKQPEEHAAADRPQVRRAVVGAAALGGVEFEDAEPQRAVPEAQVAAHEVLDGVLADERAAARVERFEAGGGGDEVRDGRHGERRALLDGEVHECGHARERGRRVGVDVAAFREVQEREGGEGCEAVQARGGDVEAAEREGGESGDGGEGGEPCVGDRGVGHAEHGKVRLRGRERQNAVVVDVRAAF